MVICNFFSLHCRHRSKVRWKLVHLSRSILWNQVKKMTGEFPSPMRRQSWCNVKRCLANERIGETG